jgi:hypothetical protein
LSRYNDSYQPVVENRVKNAAKTDWAVLSFKGRVYIYCE